MLSRSGFVALGLLLGMVSGLLATPQASADQRQDWFIADPQEEGDYLTLDLLIGGVQANYSKEIEIFGSANQLTLRGGGLLTLPFGRAAVGGDLRIVIISVGMDVGYDYFWRGLQCDPNVECHRKARRLLESGGEFEQEGFMFWQGRAQLLLPFNDYVLGVVQALHNRDNSPDNFFDYQAGVMRDQWLTTINYLLFAKHPDFGGFAPMVQQQYYTVGGKDVSQTNFGFTFLTRAGLIRDSDLLVVQLLVNSPNLLGGTDLQDSYGGHIFRGPMSLLMVYRSVLDL